MWFRRPDKRRSCWRERQECDGTSGQETLICYGVRCLEGCPGVMDESGDDSCSVVCPPIGFNASICAYWGVETICTNLQYGQKRKRSTQCATQPIVLLAGLDHPRGERMANRRLHAPHALLIALSHCRTTRLSGCCLGVSTTLVGG